MEKGRRGARVNMSVRAVYGLYRESLLGLEGADRIAILDEVSALELLGLLLLLRQATLAQLARARTHLRLDLQRSGLDRRHLLAECRLLSLQQPAQPVCSRGLRC